MESSKCLLLVKKTSDFKQGNNSTIDSTPVDRILIQFRETVSFKGRASLDFELTVEKNFSIYIQRLYTYSNLYSPFKI